MLYVDSVKLLLSFPCLKGVVQSMGDFTGFHSYNDHTICFFLILITLVFVNVQVIGGLNKVARCKQVVR